jgi:large subunit ribosomal protein L21
MTNFPRMLTRETVFGSGNKRRLENPPMYAIVKIAGRQYRAVEGQFIDVDRLPQEAGQSITIEDVLLVSNGDNVTVGQPTVKGASVTATVEEQFRGEKLIVFKYRQRTTYRRTRGHRQYHTRIRINKISV